MLKTLNRIAPGSGFSWIPYMKLWRENNWK